MQIRLRFPIWKKETRKNDEKLPWNGVITTTCLSNDVYVNQKDGLKMQSLCSLQAIPIYPWQELGFYFKLRDTLSNAQKCFVIS